jgi:arsenate reductase (glutaredoxin)
MTLYGIKNCDTVKKSRVWFAEHGGDIRFHDLRADGLDAATARHWLAQIGADRLLNRSGTTWRKLTPAQQNLRDSEDLLALLLQYPTLIRRPLVDFGSVLTVGFVPSAWQGLLEDTP